MSNAVEYLFATAFAVADQLADFMREWDRVNPPSPSR